MRRRAPSALVATLLLLAALLALAPPASAERAVEQLSFTASDGVVLHGTVSGEAPLRPRPLIVEYSPSLRRAIRRAGL